ncbi:hypothetical protein [Metasolibacillus sp.]|uniref:hypothetical protein n=1 Tax=Metasolibacillus sp. TaxID=2703680 RepID=UPI0025FF5826|nr:hypothetical protein [Metasolibacillus sp.]MCT6922795.1 hypothetical protein [Metasolibacillus sp.]MCT6938866.1 hypothetical protein [Metasolibacillus sp.]
MTNEERLALLNSMEVIEVDANGDGVIYVDVAYNAENIEKLSKVVGDVHTYLKKYGDIDGKKETIDISIAAFEHAGAEYYHEGAFVIFTKEQLLEMYEGERGKCIAVESELKNFTSQFNLVKEHVQTALNAIGN